MKRRVEIVALAVGMLVLAHDSCVGQSQVVEQIQDLDPRVLNEDERDQAVGIIQRDLLRRRESANAENRAEWNVIDSREDWEAYRDARIDRLNMSLGRFPPVPETLNAHTTGRVEGDGFHIENIVYESRIGSWVSANLYVPSESRASMPGLLIVHSHHTDKTHGELQDMGMTWARAGCLVLVIDQVGYGERRAHPFNGPEDYDGSYRVSRQDYYHRYDSGIQLSIAGDSLMGWFVWDLMRGVDLLLSRDGIDPHRIIILGSVAGGGDPCAVTAALDNRIACAVPFNFGGLQPESYPLPENAEETFNFAMSSYWDSTRGLPGTCSDGFFHWTIVGSIAPRPVIYAHEFMWDREHDPVWKRFQRIYGVFYNSPENLDYANGVGSVKDSSDVATHCTHIGRHHRQFIHPAFGQWFRIHVEPDGEYSNRVNVDELRCMTDEYRTRLNPKSLPEVALEQGQARIASMRDGLAGKPANARRRILRREWGQLLGPVEPGVAEVLTTSIDRETLTSATVEKLSVQTEEGIVVPTLVITPRNNSGAVAPVVIAVAQAGKEPFIKQRSSQLADLLEAGIAICLPDVRGTGETRSGSARGRTSNDTNLSVNMQMFGETLVGQRLRDLRSIIAWLRTRTDIDESKIAIWGDSFVEPNSPDTDFRIPHGVDRAPRQPEPLGGLLALLAALFEEDIRAISIHRGLVSYASVLNSPQVYVAHDAVVPQALNAGDLPDIAAVLSPTKVRLDSLVDELHRPVANDFVRELLVTSGAGAADAESITASRDADPALWLIDAIR